MKCIQESVIICLMKTCTKCKIEKDLHDFPIRNKGSRDGRSSWCKECVRDEWHERQRERALPRAREAHRKTREKVLQWYGSKCACCGEDRYEFLAIDHINGEGNKHRLEIGSSGFALYRWLIKNNMPVGFRVLCHNCNHSLGHDGFCPHEEGRSSRH